MASHGYPGVQGGQPSGDDASAEAAWELVRGGQLEAARLMPSE